MRALFTLRTLVLLLGFVLLALFIWFAGPYFAFNGWEPLESARARLIAIALVVGVWCAVVLAKRLRAAAAANRLMAAVVRQRDDTAPPSPDAVALRERFEEAVAQLRRTRSRRNLYDLPWYVIIGAPGSGKTTALVNSGLSFPLEQRTGKGALRGVGGTRSCDWWFTDQAVFIDTAGRYTTQDSDSSSDAAAWKEFLALLVKYRRRRPINGILLAISAADVMAHTPGVPNPHVEASRRRLVELNRELHVDVPVYLLVTKCDLVAGFSEYFDDLPQEGRAQVWGTTFPLDATRNGTAASAYPPEFDALVARLNARLFERVEEDRDARRRARIFGFPQQMAALRESLADFVADVFASTRFDQRLLLRGVYFTSGTQEGTPIDRLLGAIGRRFAVAPAAVAAAARGKAYFIERLLQQVVLGESGLAGVNRRFEVKNAAMQLAAYAAVVLAAVVAVALLSVSYRRNQTYLSEVAQVAEPVRQSPALPAGAPVDALLSRLDAVKHVADVSDRYGQGGPVSMRWGLYQGGAVSAAAHDAYARELDGALLSRVAASFQRHLVEDAADPETVYEYLKAYLMLCQPEHLDKSQLAAVADADWKAASPSSPTRSAALSRHFRTLLAADRTLRPVPCNATLVAQARSSIRQASIPRLIYRAVKLAYGADTTNGVRLDIKAGIGAEALQRKSGARLSDPVPALYTAATFKRIVDTDLPELVKQVTAEQWVWGDDGIPATDPDRLRAAVVTIYEDDYIATWDAILNDLDVPLPAGLVAETLAKISGTPSPLRGVLAALDENTYLVKPPDPEPAPDKPSIGSVIRQKAGRVVDLLPIGSAAAAAPPSGSRVTEHFEPVHKLLAGAPGAAPIDRRLDEVRQIQQKIQPVGGVGGPPPNDPQTIAALGQLVRSLQQDAQALPPALKELFGRIAASAGRSGVAGATSELRNAYEQNVQRQCVDLLHDKYPFVNSQVDVPLADFGRVFGYGGYFDQFFHEKLEPWVDTSRSPWTWRASDAGATLGMSPAVLRQFEAAQRIRDMFFEPRSAMPVVRFTVTAADLDAGATKFLLELDGQSFENRHGPPRAVAASWPGPGPAGAAATFEDSTAQRPHVALTGTWAWFRLLDSMPPQRESDVRYMLSVRLGGHQARVFIDATSVRNPFGKMREVAQFSCVPQS